jgi:hypothetical protein
MIAANLAAVAGVIYSVPTERTNVRTNGTTSHSIHLQNRARTREVRLHDAAGAGNHRQAVAVS